MAARAPKGPQAAAGAEAEIVEQATEGMLGPNPFIGLRPETVVESLGKLVGQALRHPMLGIEQTAGFARELMAVFAGRSDLAPAAGDRRFGSEIWRENAFYRSYLQSYLAWEQSLQGFVDGTSLDADDKERARFVLSIFIDAMAPTNTLVGNPDAVKRTLDTGGRNILAGLKNLAGDIVNNKGMPSQVDRSAFKPGENVATSPGAVVFRTPVLELIQYAPATKTIRARPHIFVAPEVNKYYVFDLAPGKSMVEYLVNNGFQVFAISWRNPTAEHADWGMDRYVADLLEATEVVMDIAGSKDLIMHAACSGGMTAVAAAGHLAAKGDPRVHAMTLQVAALDMTDSTPGLFATPAALAAAKFNVNRKGMLSSTEMSHGFAFMRPKEAIWNYWVNNYLMGNDPPAADLFYWANDATNLPARFFCDTMDIVIGGGFLKPGTYEILGTPIDLSKVTCDTYLVAGTTDHIMPWKGVYKVARHLGGAKVFVLSTSGHIQSLICPPPGHGKARYFLNPDIGPSPDEWVKGASVGTGSWWPHWQAWLTERSGDERAARAKLGNRKSPPIMPAPGSYVHE